MAKETSCPYCAQSDTRKDEYGYCAMYDCFDRSGLRALQQSYVSKAMKLYEIPSNASGQIGRVVSNPYNVREREAQRLKYEAARDLGLAVDRVIDSMPYGVLSKKWDRNIRW